MVPTDTVAQTIITMIATGCSCIHPQEVVYFPYFTGKAAELKFKAEQIPETCGKNDVGVFPCLTCGTTLSGHIPTQMCFQCAKKEKVALPLKHGSQIGISKKRWRCKENVKGLSVYGPIISHHAYVKAASTQDNELKSLVTRQTAPTPTPSKDEWDSFEDWVFSPDNFKDLMPDFPENTLLYNDQSYEDFLKWNNHFDARVQKANAVAWIYITRNTLTNATLKRATTIKMFLKAEKYLKTLMGSPDPSIAPRCISAWSPRTNVATGVPLSRLQAYFHKIWGRKGDGSFGNVCFPVGMDIEDISELFTEWYPKIKGFNGYENDFTLYDSTHGVRSHKFMMRLYERAGLLSWPWFEEIRKAQGGRCFGRTRHGVEFTENSTLKSGCADTCLMNTILNFLMHNYAIAKINGKNGVPLKYSQFRNDIYMEIMGDDNGTFLAPHLSVKGLPEILQNLGYISKFQKRDRVEDVTFLNMWFIQHEPGKFRATPNPFRLFGKWGYSTDPQPDPAAWCYEMGLAFRGALSVTTFGKLATEHMMRVAGDRSSAQNDGKNKRRVKTVSKRLKRELEWQYKVWARTVIQPTLMADEDLMRKTKLTRFQYDKMIESVTSYSRLPCSLGHVVAMPCFGRLAVTA